MLKKVLIKLYLLIEYSVILGLGRFVHISYVVKYLRNPSPKLTVRLLRAFNAKIGNNTTFKRSILLDNSYEDENSKDDFSHLIIGSNCYIGDMVYFDLADKIRIEDNVVISGRVSLITHSDCNRSKYLSNKFPRKCQPINIKSGAWLGFSSIILSGIIVRKNSVIGASSLLNSNTEEKSVFIGIPAKNIKLANVIKK